MDTLARLGSALAAHYEVKKEIGAGGMATVFLARDIKHDRDVAIKVLHPDLGAALGAERFLSEIKTTAKLQHPHILSLIDSGEADTLLYYVMPFVVGESLRQRMDREGQLPVNEAIRIAREVSGALDYAHRNGVVHRDIKPENILLNDGQALVADFGIALAVSAAGGARMTQTGLSLGTPQYMSPEQAMGERAIDARSDIYALGAVTYEMLTGEPPFTGPNVQAIVSKIMSQKPTPVSAVRDTVPPMTEDAVMTALCKLPADRFATAAEFSRALTEGAGLQRTVTTTAREGAGRRRMDAIAYRFGLPAIPLAIMGSAATVWLATMSSPSKPILRSTISLDSSDRLYASSAGAKVMAISPDGSTIAYVGGPRAQIFVRRRDEFRSTVLPETEGAIAPDFSPDGKQLAFGTFQSEMKTISVSGGRPALVADSVIGRGQYSWGDDGYIYTIGRYNAVIYRVPEKGGTPTAVTVLDSAATELAHFSPSGLPNKSGILFTVALGRRPAQKTMIAILKPGETRHRVLFEGYGAQYVPSGHILYRAASGAVMAIGFNPSTSALKGEAFPVQETLRSGDSPVGDFAVSKTGTFLFTTTRRRAGVIAWVTPKGDRTIVDSTTINLNVSFPRLSPDGRRVAFSGVGGIWVKQLDKGPSTKVTVEGTNSGYPSWNPDGKTLTYYSDALDPKLGLFQKRADGFGQAQAITLPDNPVESSWSPDGKWLAYRTSVAAPGKGNILATLPATNSKPVPIAVTEAHDNSPAISSDGKWLAYSSNETGRYEIFVVPFPDVGSSKWQVSSDGGSEPVWSRDGRQLFYRDGSGMMTSVPIEKGSSFVMGVPRKLFSAVSYIVGAAHQSYDVAPDGRFLMLWVPASREDEKIFVVDNWFAELQKQNQ